MTTKRSRGRGPYIREDPKLRGHVESARYIFWDKPKLPILLKTKGAVEKIGKAKMLFRMSEL